MNVRLRPRSTLQRKKKKKICSLMCNVTLTGDRHAKKKKKNWHREVGKSSRTRTTQQRCLSHFLVSLKSSQAVTIKAKPNKSKTLSLRNDVPLHTTLLPLDLGCFLLTGWWLKSNLWSTDGSKAPRVLECTIVCWYHCWRQVNQTQSESCRCFHSAVFKEANVKRNTGKKKSTWYLIPRKRII